MACESLDIIEIARPELERLRDRTNVTAHLTIRDGRELLYLCCVQTRSGFLSTFNVGARLPTYAVPMGWLLLRDLSKVDMDLRVSAARTRLRRIQFDDAALSLLMKAGRLEPVVMTWFTEKGALAFPIAEKLRKGE